MNQNSQPIESGFALIQGRALDEQQSAQAAPKARYEAPQLTTHGRLHTLTLQNGSNQTGGEEDF